MTHHCGECGGTVPPPYPKRRRWGPRRGDPERIRRHLARQDGLGPDVVRLDSGVIVPVGADAEGEADECG